MRTDWSGLALFSLFVVLLGGVAWLSRHPEAPILERAQEWPLVGPLATRYRAARLPAPAEAPPRQSKLEVVVQPPRAPDARPRIWVAAGSELRAEPADGARVVGEIDHLANLGWLERRGDWYRVERRTWDEADDLEGWVLIDDPVASQPTLPPTVEPLLPLQAVPIDESALAAARELMGAGQSAGRCGPYALWTDVDPRRLQAVCKEIVGPLEKAYSERYALEPVGPPAETLLVFARAEAFRAFDERSPKTAVEKTGLAAAARGYAALYWQDGEGRPPASTLAHELVHLINRRAIGPALPPWLSEGLANDLSDVVIGGRYEPATRQLTVERGVDAGLPLDEFVDLGYRRFHERGYPSYAQALLLVRFVADHPRFRQDFRRYLAYLASGGVEPRKALVEHLGVAWDELQEDWDHWLRSRRLAERTVAVELPID